MKGQTIRHLRKSRAWSQNHLADAAGVSVRTVQRLEKEGQASDETLLAVAAALDVDVMELTAIVPYSKDLPGANRSLWQAVSPRKSFIWGSLLLLPPVLFIVSNVLKYKLDTPQLYDAIASIGDATGLSAFTDFFTSPALLLGAPFLALLLGIMAQLRIEGSDSTNGFTFKSFTVSFHPLSSIILVCALAGIAILLGYATMENLSDWIIELMTS